MSQTSSSIGLIAHLANRAQKLSSFTTWKLWCHRSKPIWRIPAEKKLLAKKRAKHKKDYQEALAEAKNTIMEQAARLHDTSEGTALTGTSKRSCNMATLQRVHMNLLNGMHIFDQKSRKSMMASFSFDLHSFL